MLRARPGIPLLPSCLRSHPPFFFFNDTATTEIYTLSLHDALPIYAQVVTRRDPCRLDRGPRLGCCGGGIRGADQGAANKIGRAHVWTPVTPISRMPASAWKKNNDLDG